MGFLLIDLYAVMIKARKTRNRLHIYRRGCAPSVHPKKQTIPLQIS